MSLSEKYVGPALAVVAIAITLALARKKRIPHRLPYPPGPKGYPIIGNLLDLPKSLIWEGLARMAQEHDTDMLHLNLVGKNLIVVSNSDVAEDLMERRSAVYSDKPLPYMVNELMGFSRVFSLMPYGDTWRAHRKLFHRFFNVGNADQYDDKIYKALNVFFHRLSASPDRFVKHVRFLTGSLSLSVAYGLHIESEDDKLYTAAEETMKALGIAIVVGTFLVDFFPSLRYFPEWFPGAGFKTFARTARENLDYSFNVPFEGVKESFQANAITTSSFVATCLEEVPELSKDGIDEEVIRNVGGVIFLGGEETTSATLEFFFLAMTMHPEVVRLAQKELDEVVGQDRLPDISDKPQLPYVSAIMKEVLRWRPPVPIATARLVAEDDVYKGFAIPAGTVVAGNTWAMFRDESVYPDSHSFKPERFLKDGQIDPSVKDPEHTAFGWGRRICPGRHFALRLLFLTMARTLATFDISKCLDEDGNQIVPDGGCTSGGLNHPLPFRSDIKPRSAHALSLLAER